MAGAVPDKVDTRCQTRLHLWHRASNPDVVISAFNKIAAMAEATVCWVQNVHVSFNCNTHAGTHARTYTHTHVYNRENEKARERERRTQTIKRKAQKKKMHMHLSAETRLWLARTTSCRRLCQTYVKRKAAHTHARAHAHTETRTHTFTSA